jgi:DNA-binding response OmpR family regulator
MGRMVLLVGRSSARLDAYRTHLVADGFRVITTTDTPEGLRCLTALRPHLCVVDVRSLDERGWQLCETARRRPSLSSTAILILADTSGPPVPTLHARARRVGAVLYAKLLKPADLVDCVAMMVACRGPMMAPGR